MTWTAYHRRGEVLRTVVADLDARPDATLPMHLDGVAETFTDELDLVATLQLRWHTSLAGRIDAALSKQPLDLEAAVTAAWAQTAARLPGVRRALDHYRAHPLDEPMARALATATAKEHLLLAVMAGRAAVQDWSAVPIGARLEERARRRDLHGEAEVGVPVHDAGPGGDRPRTLLRRLRALVAA